MARCVFLIFTLLAFLPDLGLTGVFAWCAELDLLIYHAITSLY